MQKDDKMDDKIYKALWTDYCLSDWFINDLMTCKNGGSYVESLNALIYNRELVVKNRPVNTLSCGNQVKINIFTNLSTLVLDFSVSISFAKWKFWFANSKFAKFCHNPTKKEQIEWNRIFDRVIPVWSEMTNMVKSGQVVKMVKNGQKIFF